MIRIHNMLLAAALASSIALPCAVESLSLADLEDAQDAQMIDMDAQDGAWTYPIPYDLLMTSDYIVLAKQGKPAGRNHVPQDLVKLTCEDQLRPDPDARVPRALSDMFDAAKADGVTLYAHSGYRSYRTQKTMYSNRLKRNNGKDDGVVAYPGASDHQTGLGIDVINKAGIGKKFTSAFANTKEGKWIAEHCWDYGFVIRYQKEKEEITQITYEPWHLRYVGVQIAQYMRENNLCLEEFTSEWKEAAAAYQAAEIDENYLTSPEIYLGHARLSATETFQAIVRKQAGEIMCGVSGVTMGTCGLHIDAPTHMVPDGKTTETSRWIALSARAAF